jgi:GH43 family beta-xylosidase
MAKIFERNPDTGEIRSREIKSKGRTKFEESLNRSEILDEIWAAEKHTIDGHWYVKLTDVCEILGEDHVRE